VTRAVVIMGPSGSGKSTLGLALAQHLSWDFIDGDGLHPPGNVAKMAAGLPLDDTDREPFLRAVAQAIRERPGPCVVACSALKRQYRDLLREIVDPASPNELLFVLPRAKRATLAARLAGRRGHFMPESLLDSQLATLEEPTGDERALIIDAEIPTPLQLEAIAAECSGESALQSVHRH